MVGRRRSSVSAHDECCTLLVVRRILLASALIVTLAALSTSCGSEGSSPCELTVQAAELLLSTYGGEVGKAVSHAPGTEVCRALLELTKRNVTFTLPTSGYVAFTLPTLAP
jgi:hypothetical protein